MGGMASQITSLTIVYSTVYSGADQRKHQSPASLAFVRWIHRGLVNSPHKWPVTRKLSPFDDVIMHGVYARHPTTNSYSYGTCNEGAIGKTEAILSSMGANINQTLCITQAVLFRRWHSISNLMNYIWWIMFSQANFNEVVAFEESALICL